MDVPPFDEGQADQDPHRQFAAWFAQAAADGVHEPEAMTLSTASPDGVPSARIVLLRGWGPGGYDFFTNHGSRKGRELDANPRAALTFHWTPPGRQVRIEGGVTRVPRAEAEAYFRGRPRGHRIGAWASAQGSVIPDRAFLERRVREEEERWAAGEVEIPPYWGGYRLTPSVFEFWQARADRLHDRLVYLPDGAGGWSRRRLSP